MLRQHAGHLIVVLDENNLGDTRRSGRNVRALSPQARRRSGLHPGRCRAASAQPGVQHLG